MTKRIITAIDESMFDGNLNINSANIRVYPAQYNRSECANNNLFAVLIADDNRFEGI